MIVWTCTPWRELDRETLYDILTLRQVVFAVEQDCAVLDTDGTDREAVHLCGHEAGELVAYARLVPPTVKYVEPSIGRVVTHPKVRRTGAGRVLMAEAVARCTVLFGGTIRIGAQKYLERFYGNFGFLVTGAPYMEDGIEHIEMVRHA